MFCDILTQVTAIVFATSSKENFKGSKFQFQLARYNNTKHSVRRLSSLTNDDRLWDRKAEKICFCDT